MFPTYFRLRGGPRPYPNPTPNPNPNQVVLGGAVGLALYLKSRGSKKGVLPN